MRGLSHTIKRWQYATREAREGQLVRFAWMASANDCSFNWWINWHMIRPIFNVYNLYFLKKAGRMKRR